MAATDACRQRGPEKSSARRGRCQQCGGEVSWVGTRPRKWCSQACRKRAQYERDPESARAYSRRSAAKRRAANPRPCGGCGDPLPPGRRRYCSDSCTPASTLSKTGRLAPKVRACTICGVDLVQGFPARFRCDEHRGLRVQRPWSERKHTPGNASKNHARRSATRGVGVERIDVQAVYERDGWRCHLCRRVVDRGLVYPHPQSASIDHLVPLSRGGAHEPANVALAHLSCNRRRGTRGAAQLRWTA